MSKTTVLVVEDEANLVGLYVRLLRPQYDVWTAGKVSDTLSEIDESVDAVLLDRRFPDRSGDK